MTTREGRQMVEISSTIDWESRDRVFRTDLSLDYTCVCCIRRAAINELTVHAKKQVTRSMASVRLHPTQKDAKGGASVSVPSSQKYAGTYYSPRDHAAGPSIPLVLRCSVVNCERPPSILIVADSKDRREVTASIAVVRCGPNGNKLFVEHIFVPLLYELMCSGYEI